MLLQSYVTTGTRSSTLPVTLAEIKADRNITGSTEDSRLTQLIWNAVDWLERQTGRCLVTTAITENFSFFPGIWQGDALQAPALLSVNPLFPSFYYPSGQPFRWGERQRVTFSRSPVQSLTSLKYYDTANAQQTLVSGTDFYFLNPSDRVPFLQPASVWPAVYARPDAVELKYSAGWSAVPGVVNAAVRVVVGLSNESREGWPVPDNLAVMLHSIATGSYC